MSYAQNTIAAPCGNYTQTITGGPYNNTYIGNQGGVCSAGNHLFQVGQTTTTYNYTITGAGHDEYQSGSVSYNVS